MAIYKHDQGVELRPTEIRETTPVSVVLAGPMTAGFEVRRQINTRPRMPPPDIQLMTYLGLIVFVNQLKVEGDVEVQVSYYNERLAAWEPLLEPVIVKDEKSMWRVQVKVTIWDVTASICSL